MLVQKADVPQMLMQCYSGIASLSAHLRLVWATMTGWRCKQDRRKMGRKKMVTLLVTPISSTLSRSIQNIGRMLYQQQSWRKVYQKVIKTNGEGEKNRNSFSRHPICLANCPVQPITALQPQFLSHFQGDLKSNNGQCGIERYLSSFRLCKLRAYTHESWD